MFPWIFFKRSTKESIITASFAERTLQQPCLARGDYETTLLTFTMHIVFSFKYSPKKAINSSLRKAFCL